MRTMLVALAALAATAIGCEEPTPCTTNDECGPSEVCSDGDCAEAFGVRYDLVGASATGISDFRPPPLSGLWDTGEDPDPYLELTAGEWTCQTFHDTNTKSPTWADLTNCAAVVLDAETRISWSLWDHDGNDPAELIAELAEGDELGVTVEELHAGSVASTVGDVTVELDFAPTITLIR